jgi:hypothetical protein
MALESASLAQFIPVPTGNVPTGITKIVTSAVSAYPVSANSVIHSNVRATSSSTTLADYLVVNYSTTNTSLIMQPTKVDVYPGVGIYCEPDGLLMKDLSSAGVLKQGAVTVPWGKATKLSFGTPVTATLEAGMNLAIAILSPTAESIVEFTIPSGQKFNAARIPKTTTSYLYSIPILRTGTYSIRLVPVTGTAAVSASINLNHNNNAKVLVIPAGVTNASFSTVTGILPAYSQAYFKMKVTLNAGKALKLTMTSSSRMDAFMIDSNNQAVWGFGNLVTGSSVTTPPVSTAGDYYIVLRKDETIYTSAANSKGTLTIQ